MVRRFLEMVGEYFIFLGKVFSKPAKKSEFFRKLVDEMSSMGIYRSKLQLQRMMKLAV